MGNGEWGVGNSRRKRIYILMCIILFFFSVFFLLSQESLPDEDGIDVLEMHPDETGPVDFYPEDFWPEDFHQDDILWYRSNSSGMALELIPSRMGAMRNEYALLVQRIYSWELPGILPEVIKPYYEDFYRVELRLLYKNAEENRRQWIFRDSRGVTRLVASGNTAFFSEEDQRVSDYRNEDSGESDSSEDENDNEKENRSGFIEIRDSEGTVVREFQFDEDLSEWEYRYFHRGSTLLRTEIWFKAAAVEIVPDEEDSSGVPDGEESGDEQEPPARVIFPPEERGEPVFVLAFTDYYRYTRSGSLRAIDRMIHENPGMRSRVGFPRLGPGVTPDTDLVIYGGIYSASYFMKVHSLPEGITISYNLDSRGRILSEIWKGEDGKIIGELRNIWTDDRVQSVSWKSGEDERRIEFEYDRDGNPVVERNFRNDVLDRIVTIEGNTEIEEIFMNGRLILRAFWENGLKISEERIFSSGGGSR